MSDLPLLGLGLPAVVVDGDGGVGARLDTERGVGGTLQVLARLGVAMVNSENKCKISPFSFHHLEFNNHSCLTS